MSLDIELYRNRLEVYKTVGKDGRIDPIQKQIMNDFMKNPSYFDVLIDGLDVGVHIVSDKNNQYKLLCKPDEKIEAGNYIVWNDKTFLCTSVDENDTVQSTGIIQKTNHNLKFINSTNKLITRPCIWSAKTLYTTGVKEEKLITIPDGMVGIQLPYDEETKQLKRGDEFIFNDNKYKITFTNKVEYKGLIVIMCDEGNFSPSTDDMVNEIANRYINGVDRLSPTEPEPEEPNPSEGITYTLTGSDTLKVLDSQIYTAKKFIDGVEDITAKFDWAVSDMTMASIWEETDTTLDLEGLNGKVGQYFTITATDKVSGESVSKQVRLINMY